MPTFASRHELETIRLTNAHGLMFGLFSNGGLCRAMCGDILINQIIGSPVDGALNNVYVRLKDRDAIAFFPLVGPTSPLTFSSAPRHARWHGQCEDLAVTCSLTLHPAETLWWWTVDLRNLGTADRVCDVIYVQDIGLAHEGAVRTNEAYCSHYIDHHVLSHAQHGFVVCSRQNQACEGNHPWLMQGCTGHAQGYDTDGVSFYGVSYKYDAIPYALTQDRLANEKRQYEMALCALQSDDLTIAPGAHRSVTFYAVYVRHHADATHDADADRIAAAITHVTEAQSQQYEPPLTQRDAVHTVFHDVQLLTGRDLDDDDVRGLFPGPRRHEEISEGQLLSFFYGEATHVVCKAKEGLVERPHGHILRSSTSLFPHDDVMSSTTYMYGVFHSHLTIGNTAFHKLLSLSRTPLNIMKSSGLRIFVEHEGSYKLLGMPSGYEMELSACRWMYKTDHGWIVVRSWLSTEEPVAFLSITSDPVQAFVIVGNVVLGTHELDQPGDIEIDARTATVTLIPHADTDMKRQYPEAVFYVTTATPEQVENIGTDAWLFADRHSRHLPYFTIQTKPVHNFAIALTGSVIQADNAAALCRKYQEQSGDVAHDQHRARAFWQALGGRAHFALAHNPTVAERFNDLFSWYVQNAMVHWTIPHGLEQYTGAAWGVRDVCQGPIELLYATRHYAEMRAVLLRVFSQQYEETADWPQWFMFDRFVTIQHPESHGDVIVWPLKALALYLEATSDWPVLDVEIPYTDRQRFTPTTTRTTLLHHVLHAIDAIEARFLPGTALSCYGGGDWNDTLQPAEAAMRERMVSAWTVSLTYQAFTQLAAALQRAGHRREYERVQHVATRIHADSQRYLISDGVVSGFSYVHVDGRVEPLMHPRDVRTGIHYRLLPMTRSIIGELFSLEQAQHHVHLIAEQLAFPDGVRLMDRPVPYHGGVRRVFRRAEEAAYFGREVGLQYVHAHIRYLEAMCKMGYATKAYTALGHIMPIGMREYVPQAQLRQCNAYFSSSDADVKDRYEAEQSFVALKEGRIPVKGGWRVYSSGPGIWINQVLTAFLGLRDLYEYRVIDPVLPTSLDGVHFTREEDGKSVTYVFAIAHEDGAAVRAIAINGHDIAFTRQHNPYRQGGAMIPRSDFRALLHNGKNIVSVSVSAAS
jgi:cellobiose phosphorylase